MKRGTIEDKKVWLHSIGIKFPQDAPEEAIDPLRAAAQAVVERWDTPAWKDVAATATYINRLREALK